MRYELEYCPKCGDAAYLDSNKEIKCHSCDFAGNPQIVFPVCPICRKVSLNFNDNKVACTDKECEYSATAGSAALDYIYKVLGYSDNANQNENLSEYAIYCPDCGGEAVHDLDKDVVFCYTCGGGWTNTQFMVCEYCGNVTMKESFYKDKGLCQDCMDEEEAENDEDDDGFN